MSPARARKGAEQKPRAEQQPRHEPGLDRERIHELVEMMEEHDILELEIEETGFRVKLRRAPPEETRSVGVTAMLPAVPAQPAVFPSAPPPPAAPGSAEAKVRAAPEKSATREIKSPTVGTFYRAPTPDAPPFVEADDEVTPDTIVCIIEAMKVMNEVRAEMSGTVVAILVENSQPVEYGQPLFRIAPRG